MDENWYIKNSTCLKQAVNNIYTLLETSEDITSVKDQQKIFELPEAIYPPAALEILATQFKLSQPEIALLLLCVGVELMPEFGELLVRLQGNANQYPTFNLGFNRLGLDWSMAKPDASLRYWQLIEIEKNLNLANSSLRISEWALFYLMGYPTLDYWLNTFVKKINANQFKLKRENDFASVLIDFWNQENNSNQCLIPVIVSDNRYQAQYMTALAANYYHVPCYYFDLYSLPNHRYDLDSYRRLLEREIVLSNGVYLINCDRLNLESDTYHIKDMLETLLQHFPSNCVLAANHNIKWLKTPFEPVYIKYFSKDLPLTN